MQQFHPHPYQQAGIEAILEKPGVALWMEMGLGKTVVTLTAIDQLIYDRLEISRALIIAPKKVAEATWQDEAEKWEHLQHLRISTVLGTEKQRKASLEAPADIYIINRENVPWLVHTLGRGWNFDMVVLDVNLPGREDGYALARELRGDDGMGILFLSARQEALDRIVGLEIGADDFMVKPFEPRELLARIRAILRRIPAPAGTRPADPGADATGPTPPRAGRLRFGEWQLDLATRQLHDAQNRIRSLTTQEFNLLSVLAQRPGRILSRDQLMDLTVNRTWSPYDRSVDVMIGKIRRKIGDMGPEYHRIRTIRGIGYMFSPDP